MEKCKFGFGDWSFLRISGKSLTQILKKKIHADLNEKERRFSFLWFEDKTGQKIIVS